MLLRQSLFAFLALVAAAVSPAQANDGPPAAPQAAPLDGGAGSPQRVSVPEVWLSRLDDSGPNGRDGLTNVVAPRLEGRAKPRSTVVIVQKRLAIARVKVPDNGRFTVTLPLLSEGEHKLFAVQLVTEDSGYYSPELKIEIDSTPPPEPEFEVISDSFLVGRIASFKGRASEDTWRARLMLGTKQVAIVYSVQRTFRFDNVPLPAGHQQLRVRLVDWAGNQMDSAPIDVYVVQPREGEDLKALDGSNGFRLAESNPNSLTGYSVSPAGDVNGDGISDILFGAPGDHRGRHEDRGRAYIRFGTRDPMPRVVSLAEMLPSEGFAIEREDKSRIFGYSVSDIGDFNGDGLDDFAIGDPLFGDAKSPEGAVYVVFGTTASHGRSLKIDELDGVKGFTLLGATGDNVGGSISGGHDFNGDGIDDFVVGAGAGTGAKAKPRPVYIVYGRFAPVAPVVSLHNLGPTEGLRVTGRSATFGYSVSMGRDVSGDGMADAVISEPASEKGPATATRGALHVLFGRERSIDRLSVQSMTNRDGVSMTGKFSPRLHEAFRIGAATSGHDINADGHGDIVVSAAFTKGGKRVTAGFVIFGGSKSRLGKIDLATLDGKDGFRLEYQRNKNLLKTPYSTTADDTLEGIDDFNADGIDDIIISTTGQWQGPRAETFVVFGSRKSYPPVLYVDTLASRSGRTFSALWGNVGFSVAGAGDVNADGIGDILIGAPTGQSRFHETGFVYVIFGSSPKKSPRRL